jgi:hypothetical protein
MAEGLLPVTALPSEIEFAAHPMCCVPTCVHSQHALHLEAQIGGRSCVCLVLSASIQNGCLQTIQTSNSSVACAGGYKRVWAVDCGAILVSSALHICTTVILLSEPEQCTCLCTLHTFPSALSRCCWSLTCLLCAV